MKSISSPSVDGCTHIVLTAKVDTHDSKSMQLWLFSSFGFAWRIACSPTGRENVLNTWVYVNISKNRGMIRSMVHSSQVENKADLSLRKVNLLKIYDFPEVVIEKKKRLSWLKWKTENFKWFNFSWMPAVQALSTIGEGKLSDSARCYLWGRHLLASSQQVVWLIID